MRKLKLVFSSLIFMVILALNISVYIDNPFKEISLSEIEMLNATADSEDWEGKSDVGCVECAQPGVVQYYCKTGTSTCFQTDCVGGIC